MEPVKDSGVADNPFLALFESAPVPKAPEAKTAKKSSPKRENFSGAGVTKRLQRVNTAIEDIFAITVNPYGLLGRDVNDLSRKHGLVLMESMALEMQHEQKGRSWLDLDVLGQALFERLLLDKQDLDKAVICDHDHTSHEGHVVQTNVIIYLAECFRRCHIQETNLKRRSPKTKEEGDDDVIEALGTMMEMIIQNTSTAIREPDLYAGQDLQDQVSQVLDKYGDLEISVVDWLEQTLAHLKSENEFETGRRLVLKIFMQIMAELHKVPFGVMGENSIKKIHYFTRTPLLATVFIMQHFVPNSPAVSGRSYMNSLLGILLSKSCLPDSDLETYDFFEEPSKQSASVHNHTEARIWTGLEIIQEICHGIINSLLRVDKSVKDWTLLWIGKCLEDNAGRGKMWTREAGPLLANTLASDGFMLNLGAVLLRFCQPFTEGVTNAKIMKIDPTYTSVEINVAEDAKLRQVHLRDAKIETFLVPSTDEEKEAENIPESFGFVTDIFFLTHKSLDLGFRVCHEKFVKMNQELGRQQQMYRDLQTQGQGSSPAAEVVQKRMEALMTRYLSLKAALLVPSTLQGAMFFSAASGSWMVQLALTLDSPRLARVQDLNFPLKEAGGENIPPSLKHVPEFVMENICELLLLVRRFCPRVFEQNGEYLSPILDFILTYMGSPKWVKNPHLRARLAECLECLLPHHQQEGVLNALGSFHREQLFQGHPHRLQIVPSLLHVFVDIETTGQAVEFEMKFSYRRPMYDVIKYVWEIEEYRKKFFEMAAYAEEHIEDEDAPLFLRFTNLLINDAIFLLDEALGYMKQIQEQQLEREQSWSSLPAQERSQNEAQLLHIGRLARYHNIMGTETIQMLDRLTGAINAVFTHPTMVDRIAAMLNFFLKNLVGPNRKSFKVKNLEEFSFRPGEIVTDICKIYVNLQNCDSFLASVSRDGRSYSPDLFDQAAEVLFKIGKGDLVSDLREVAKKVGHSAVSQKADDELFSDAPDEFLDSIMSHLMTDPVRLPNSGQIVDRSTIARHLLSDQNDPFTRAPLNMEQVEPLSDLRDAIEAWMEEKRKQK